MKLVGAQVVVDLSNSPSFEDEEVLRFFETRATRFEDWLRRASRR